MAHIEEPFSFTIIRTMAPQNKTASQLRIFAMGEKPRLLFLFLLIKSIRDKHKAKHSHIVQSIKHYEN